MSESGHHTLITLKENRFSIFSLILVLLAFALTAWIAYLNYQMHQSAGAQLLRSQQLQEMSQARLQQQYTEYLKQQAINTRFEKSFEIRQRYYAHFMAAVSDAWLSVGRKNVSGLNDALNRMEKSYFGLEPFLTAGGRHFLKKRMTQYQTLAMQLTDDRYEYQGNRLADKKTLSQMSDDFQSFLFPRLFEPQADSETKPNDISPADKSQAGNTQPDKTTPQADKGQP